MLSAEEQQQLQIRLCTKESELEIPHNVFSISAKFPKMELYPILESRDAASANIWYVVTPQGPQVDGGVGTKCCAKGYKVIVCGGANPAGAFGNIYEVCLDRFSLRKLSSTVTPRYEHAMVLHDDRLIVFGGAGLEGNMNDVECVDIVNDVKLPVPSSDTAPCPRTIHNVARNDQALYVWGGGAQGSEAVSCTDTFSLDLVTLKWNKLTTSGTPPSPRHGHVLCCTDEMLYVHGGMSGEDFYNDMYSLDLSSGTWSKIELNSPHPSPRAAHIATLHKGKVYMFGGLSKEGALDDLWVFDCKIREWSEVKVAPPSPHPRLDHCMCVVAVPYCKDNVGNTTKATVPLTTDGITDITDLLLPPATDTTEEKEEPESADSEQKMLYMFGGMDTQGNIFNDMYVMLLED